MPLLLLTLRLSQLPLQSYDVAKANNTCRSRQPFDFLLQFNEEVEWVLGLVVYVGISLSLRPGGFCSHVWKKQKKKIREDSNLPFGQNPPYFTLLGVGDSLLNWTEIAS